MNSHSRRKTLRAYVDAQPRQKSQNDIADDLGISKSMLSSYLSGRRNFGREVALRLSREFGFDLEELLDPNGSEAKAS